jgi:hypothetical protein
VRRISERQRIQCAAALVRRSVYEQLGGYRSDLFYALDWEMWVRIAAHYDVWYEPRVLAYYRRHDSSETARLRKHSSISCDVLHAISVFAEHLPAERRERLLSAAYCAFARRTLKQLASQADDSAERLKSVNFAISRITHSRCLALRYRRLAARLERK